MSILVLPFKRVYLKRDKAVSSSTEVTLLRSVFSINAATACALSIDFLIYKNVREALKKHFRDDIQIWINKIGS